MCLFAYDLGFVVPEDLEVRDPADLKYLRVPVCGLAPGAVYDPGIFVTDSPALSRAASESRSRTAAWARGRCQGGAGRGRRQVLRKLSAAGRQRARPAAWHGGRRVARGDVRARGCCVCPCQPGLPVSVAAHSAATAMRAQRARFLPLPPPSLSTGGSRIAPPLCPLRAVLRRSFSVDDVERMVGPRGHLVPPVRTGEMDAAARSAVEPQVHQGAGLCCGVAAEIGAGRGCRGRGARFKEPLGSYGPGSRRAALRGGFAALRPAGGDRGGQRGRRVAAR